MLITIKTQNLGSLTIGKVWGEVMKNFKKRKNNPCAFKKELFFIAHPLPQHNQWTKKGVEYPIKNRGDVVNVKRWTSLKWHCILGGYLNVTFILAKTSWF